MFRQVFSKPRVVLPVIHVKDGAQAMENARVALGEGADGVFLIGHGRGMDCDNLLLIQQQLREAMPAAWIGVNCLDLSPVDVFAHVTNLVSGVWVDNAEIQESAVVQTEAARIESAKREHGYRGLYFGGVAFKYQRHVADLARGALIAKEYVDVVTTSGIGTGSEPDVAKVETMRAALGDHPPAIASGITPENVRNYLAADVFMVATGISRDFYNFDPARVASLVKAVAE
jgi:predicted TIM-barrel enzyme